MRILIADDEDSIRDGIAKYIRLHSDMFEDVLTAKNGLEACDLIYKYKPEIMLLDIQMPIKSGLQVMKEVSRAGILPATIILSSYDEFSYAQTALHLGAREYILKPCRSTSILSVIEELAATLKGSKKPVNKIKTGNSIIDEVIEIINDQYYSQLTLDSVSEKVGVTGGYLSSLFKSCMGIGFIDYLKRIRIERACEYLSQNTLKTYEVAYKVGFTDEKYFSKVFRQITGLSPSEYKKQ